MDCRLSRLLVRGHLSIDEYIMETRTMGFADGSGELRSVGPTVRSE